MTERHASRELREQELNRLIQRYYESQERGQAPDPAAYIKAHPAFALELQSFFQDLQQLEQAFDREHAPVAEGASDKVADDLTVDSKHSSRRSRTGAGQVVGEYQILEEVARGGMGVVYKAWQPRLGRIVALKAILGGRFASPTEVERLRREARAAAALKHPHIVTILDMGTDQGLHYFTMDFVDGASLAEILYQGALEARESVELLETLAQAIDFAHQRGVVHRDLKPGNVLIDERRRPHIVDFGLSKAPNDLECQSSEDLTGTGQVLGTPSYMSPEQAAAEHQRVGPASDVYSLGAILYACLCGRAPFVAASAVETVRQVIEQEPVPVRVLSPQIPKDLETICLKCLQKDPAKRYRSAGELADDLKRFLRGLPISARPISTATRIWRMAKRNPAAALATALLVSLSVAGPLFAVHEISLRRQSDSHARRAASQEAKAKQHAGRAESLRQLAERRAAAETLAKQAAVVAARRARQQQFIAELNLVGYHWESGNIVAVRRLLGAQVPGPDEDDFREFTWSYWSARLQARDQLDGGQTPVPHAVHTRVSPDGQRIAFAGSRGEIHVRRRDAVDDADEIVLPLVTQPRLNLGVAFVLDGDTLAVREATAISIWDLSQEPPGHELIPMTATMEGSLGRNTFSENGRYLTATRGSRVEILDLVEKQVVHKVSLPVKPINLRHLHVSDDASRLLTSTGMDWNLVEEHATGELDHELYADRVAPAPWGSGMVTLGTRRELILWSAEGEPRELESQVIAFDVDRANGQICWATQRGVYLVNEDTLDDPRLIPQRGLMAVTFAPDGEQVLGVAPDRLYVWPLEAFAWGEPVPLVNWSRGMPSSCSPRGRYYAGHVAGELCVWDRLDGRLIHRSMVASTPARGPLEDGAIRSLAVSDELRVATCSMRGDVDLWDGRTGAPIKTLRQPDLPDDATAAVPTGLMQVEISSDGNTVAAMSLGGQVLVWKLAEETLDVIEAAAHFTRPMRLAPDGESLVVYRRDVGREAVWNLVDRRWDDRLPAWDHFLLLADRWVFVETSAETLRILDPQSGATIHELSGHAGLASIAASPDGKTLATLYSDGSLILWDARMQAPLLTEETATGELAFVDQGRVLSLVDRDGKMRFWRGGSAPPSD